MRLKHYAGILLIEFWDDLIYNMDTGKAVSCVPDHCQPLEPRQRWRGPPAAPLACHDLYQIFQVLSLHIPQWSSNDAFTVWWNVSGRFLGPIK